MRPSLSASMGRGSLYHRESPSRSRRIGVIVSIMFLTSVGMAATVTGARADAQGTMTAQSPAAAH